MSDSINHRIRKLRQTLGLKQMEFAKSISISTSYLAGIESGFKQGVSDRIIKEICSTHKVSMTWLKTGKGKVFAPLSNTSKTDKILYEAFCIYESLTPKYQKYILMQMKDLNRMQGTEEESSPVKKTAKKTVKKKSSIRKPLP